ncbi:hypothetical protein Tco_0743643 [Tanacetum coccineum]
MVTGVPGQEGAEGNVAEKKKVKESMEASLGKLLKYNVWSTRWSPIREGKQRNFIVSIQEMTASKESFHERRRQEESIKQETANKSRQKERWQARNSDRCESR